jgi:hypothetical protein
MVITVGEYDLDQTLAKEILTDEAIQAFECETTEKHDDDVMDERQDMNAWGGGK